MKNPIFKTCRPNVFISYRTSDTGLIVPRIAQKLKKTVGRTIFWDKRSLEPGIDYRPQIQSKIKECNYALIIIGENWYLKDPEKLKESDEVDYFKIELEGLLDRAEKDKLAVTPVLIDKASLPSKSNIPPEILQLIYNHRFELNSGVDFDHHMNELSKKIKEHLDCRYRRVFKFLIPFLLISILVLSYLVLFKNSWPIQNSDFKVTQETRINNCYSFLGATPWLNWIVYDPIDYDPYGNTMPSEASIRKDIRVLSEHGFDGLITIHCKGNCKHIARIAHEEGINQVIVGIWELRNEDEVNNAKSVAKWADAYCLGSKGLHKHYSKGELLSLITSFKNETQKCITTSEGLVDYTLNPDIAKQIDFYFPDIHVVDTTLSPKILYDSIIVLAKLAAEELGGDKIILLKMIGFPSAGHPNFSHETQTAFYKLMVEATLDRSDIPGNICFSYMCAFDPIWKTKDFFWPEYEKYTGLFDSLRQPKPVIHSVEWRKRHH